MTSGLLDVAMSNVNSLRQGLESKARQIVEDMSRYILEVQREQLKKGLAGDGENIAPKYRSFEYAKYKNKLNPLPDFRTPDLLLTGAFQRGFFLTAKDGEFTIFSRDIKADKLASKYGSSIFEVEPDRMGKINKKVFEKLIEWIISKLEI